MNKVYKYFFYIFIILIFTSLITVTFNSKLRRLSFNYLINAYKVYMLVSVQNDLKKGTVNYDSAAKKISTFIQNSRKIAFGKSSLLIGISDTIDLIESTIINEQDFGKFEKSLEELVELDPSLFNARVALAKSYYSNGKTQQAKEQIFKALELSPINHETYRILLRIGTQNFNQKEIKNICKRYHEANLGGIKERYKSSYFTGFNLNKFAVQINPSNNLREDIYPLSGINLNETNIYEIVPKAKININSLNLLFNFVPGTMLKIENIIFVSDNQESILNSNDFFMT